MHEIMLRVGVSICTYFQVNLLDFKDKFLYFCRGGGEFFVLGFLCLLFGEKIAEIRLKNQENIICILYKIYMFEENGLIYITTDIQASSYLKWRFSCSIWDSGKTTLKVNRVFVGLEISLRFFRFFRPNRMQNKCAIDESSRTTRIDDDFSCRFNRKCIKTCEQGLFFLANSKMKKKIRKNCHQGQEI